MRLGPLIVSAVCVAPAGAADPASDEVQSLRKEVAELRAEVAELRAGRDQDWLTTQRAAQIRALVEDALADAGTRAGLLDEGATAGWDKGFFMKSADGNFLLRINGQLDLRWVLNHQNDAPLTDDTVYGFEVRRARLNFQGHVIDPSWQYRVQTGFNRSTGTLVLEDAYVNKMFGEDVGLMIGQFKVPFLMEETMPSSRQLAVERSLVNEEFNQDRSKAVQA